MRKMGTRGDGRDPSCSIGSLSWRTVALTAALLSSCVPGAGEEPPSSAAPPSSLEVAPLAGFLSTGQEGGPFDPVSEEYTLFNDGLVPIDWTASATQPWAELSAVGGQLDPGESATLTVSIGEDASEAMAVGRYTGRVNIVDQSTGRTFRRAVTLQVLHREGSALTVTPSEDFLSRGEEGGPFVPGWMDYTITNTSETAVAWSAGHDRTGIVLLEGATPTSGGVLEAGASTVLTVQIDQAVAGTVTPGTYVAQLLISDDSIGFAFDRGVVLQVDESTVPPPADGLVATPSSSFTSAGYEGGPFAPTRTDYFLENVGGSPLDWSAAVDEPAFSLSATGGRLAPGARTSLTVSVDPTIAASYGLGTYAGTLTLNNLTFGSVSTRGLTLHVNSSTTGTTASSLQQFGITWTFDRPYEVGQFANGDWWVVGPVTITSITPPSEKIRGRTINGSMVNPTPRDGQRQGYDSTMYAQYRLPEYFGQELNAAYGVDAANPLVLQPHSSLVSTISEAVPESRPQLETCAILTVLPEGAPLGSFRPPYCGSDKSIRFNESQLDYSLLARLAIPPGVGPITSLKEAERMFERPWLDHVPLWVNNYLHPSENMPDYGREIVDNVSVGAILLHLDFPPSQKRTLLVRYVQLGIDNYGVAMDDGHSVWPPSAGHMSGRKWPILFAGLMLGDPGMSSIGFDKTIQFGEDGQTFYVTETSPGVINYGWGGYTPGMLSVAEWGTSHSIRPELDDSTWFGDPYRLCCTSNAWWGQLLACHVMGVKSLWDHDALFDYQDRFLAENENVYHVEDWRLSWRRWYLELWKVYRPNYP